MEFIVNALDFEENKVFSTWRMNHPNIAHNSKKVQEAWNNALAQAKEANPEEWNVTDIIKIMGEQGWEIERIDAVKVSY